MVNPAPSGILIVCGSRSQKNRNAKAVSHAMFPTLMSIRRHTIGFSAFVLSVVCAMAHAETVTITEDFSTGPKWDGRNNVRTERGREK